LRRLRSDRRRQGEAERVIGPDPMNGGHPLSVRARESIATVVRRTPAGKERTVLVAGLALRLAELGHVKDVSIKVAGGEEAARAALAYLAEMEARAQNVPNGDAASPDELEPVLPLPNPIQSVRKRARACLECGRDFEVNPRHAESHRFHSAACRS